MKVCMSCHLHGYISYKLMLMIQENLVWSETCNLFCWLNRNGMECLGKMVHFRAESTVKSVPAAILCLA